MTPPGAAWLEAVSAEPLSRWDEVSLIPRGAPGGALPQVASSLYVRFGWAKRIGPDGRLSKTAKRQYRYALKIQLKARWPRKSWRRSAPARPARSPSWAGRSDAGASSSSASSPPTAPTTATPTRSTESSNCTGASQAATATTPTTDFACSWSRAHCSSHRNSDEPIWQWRGANLKVQSHPQRSRKSPPDSPPSSSCVHTHPPCPALLLRGYDTKGVVSVFTALAPAGRAWPACRAPWTWRRLASSG